MAILCGRSSWCQWALAVACLLCVACGRGSASSFQNKCQRESKTTEVSKTPGDGQFKIKISGNPEMYVPGEVYTVSLQGSRHEYSVQKFTGFMLVVESASRSAHYSFQSVGTYQLYGDVLTMHSDGCPNTVIQTSNILKSEIQVLWTAPPTGSGCLRFKATVIESRDVWYMDDGELTKDLCEEVHESDDMQPEVIFDCCTCNEAKYEVTFEGLWSRQTHPKDFPSNEWLTHFSDIIGASHSNKYRVWEHGGLASDGLKQVAVWGSTRTLESELKRQSEQIRTIIKARGLWYPNVNGKTFAVFRVDNRHHLMSLVSMLGPSPDWVVGVSAMELCLRNCSWVAQKTLNLYPWDAGTDSGVTYMSANSPSIPRQHIRRITNSSPNDQKSPFYDPKGLPMKPLARLTITRQRVYEKTCSDTGQPGRYDDNDNHRYGPSFETEETDADRPECAVTPWSEFGPCPMTCGKGIHIRTREYAIPMKAEMMRCSRELSSKQMCKVAVPYCPGGSAHNIFGSSNRVENPYQESEGSSDCRKTEWSDWSPCSASCGEGTVSRSRRYLDRMGRKRCNSKELFDRKPCMADVAVCEQGEEPTDPACEATQWTTWSLCTVTCGAGLRQRMRYFLEPTANENDCNVKTIDKMPCNAGRADCSIHASEAKEVCLKEKDVGPCRGYQPKWYYNPVLRICMQFIYGGCRGNRNRFDKLDECTRTCEFARDELDKEPSNQFHHSRPHGIPSFRQGESGAGSADTEGQARFGGLTSESQLGPPPVDCVVSEWSDWPDCPVTCGSGWKTIRRTVQVEPENGGKSCPKKLVKRHKCKLPRCNKPNHNLQVMNAIFDPQPEHNLSPIRHPYSPVLESEEEDLMKQIDAEGANVDCVMGNWGPWTPCSHSCGSESLQQRVRSIVVKARGGGVPCGPSLERRYCTLPPCPHHRG